MTSCQVVSHLLVAISVSRFGHWLVVSIRLGPIEQRARLCFTLRRVQLCLSLVSDPQCVIYCLVTLSHILCFFRSAHLPTGSRENTNLCCLCIVIETLLRDHLTCDY